MFAKENILEDVYYRKIVPNRYIVEVNEDNFERNYHTIQKQITQQWSQRLLDQLMTANTRLGRREYSFGGPVLVEIRPASDLAGSQVRIRFRVQAEEAQETDDAQPARACLELSPGRQRWQLHRGTVTIGRYDICDIHLNMPEVQERRMISGQHAHIRSEPDGGFRLFDGSVAGKPSVNGTFVNYQRVPPGGHLLRNGDFIILAAPDAENPRPGVPGAVSFYFFEDCGG
jgi:hypothetical protein